MSKINLSEGFSLIPIGTHVFQVTEVKYKEDFGKLEIAMKTVKGQKHIERFSLLNSSGEPNEGALNAFSYFAKCCLNDFSRTDVEPEELVGCFIRCGVDHEEVQSNKDASKTLTFVRLTEKEPADGFDEPVPEKKASTTTKSDSGKKKFDLDSLLG